VNKNTKYKHVLRPNPGPDPIGNWSSLRVAPATGGQTTNMLSQGGISTDPKNVVCGSVQAVLAHPESADVCFAGASSGG
jgi:hypothetical protein